MRGRWQFFSQLELVRGPVRGERKLGQSEEKARREDEERGRLRVCSVTLFTACGIKAGGAVAAFPGKDKAEVGRGGVLPLCQATTVPSFDFWLGMKGS